MSPLTSYGLLSRALPSLSQVAAKFPANPCHAFVRHRFSTHRHLSSHQPSAPLRSSSSSAPKPTSTSTPTSAARPSPRRVTRLRHGGRSPQRQAEIRRRNRNLLAWALALVFATVGLSYASVPLYRLFCQVTGFGGTVRRAPTANRTITDDGEDDSDDDDALAPIDETNIVRGRPITIRFNADVSARVPWRFTPLQSEVVVLPGETALAFYLAENKSSTAVTGIATYNITPPKAAIYFNKVQCFCFDEQRLKPGEALDMPVFFYIDPEFAKDDDMADVSDIMLSYTFFKAEDVTPEQLLRAQALAMGQDSTKTSH